MSAAAWPVPGRLADPDRRRRLGNWLLPVMPLADFGVQSLSQGLLAHDDTIAQNPEFVRRFLRASTRGVRDCTAEASCDAATDAAMKLSRAIANRRESVKLQWVSTEPPLGTPHAVGRPLGWTAGADWRNGVALLAKTAAITQPVSPGTHLTNDFVPA